MPHSFVKVLFIRQSFIQINLNYNATLIRQSFIQINLNYNATLTPHTRQQFD